MHLSKMLEPTYRQQKGLWLVSFLFLTEFVTISNSVNLWSTQQNHGKSSFDNNKKHENKENLHCNINNNNEKKRFKLFSKEQYYDDACTMNVFANAAATATTTASSSSIHPRLTRRLAVSSSTPSIRLGSHFQECCLQSCPSCLSIRGGSTTTSSTLHSAAETVASAAAGANSLTPFNLHLNVWKIIFQFCLTTMNVLCWYVPLKSKKISENKLGLSLANAFSGGVFLSLAFGHLIPECVHGFTSNVGEYNEALPYMIVLGGYLLIFFVEKVAFDTHGLMEGSSGADHDDVKSEPMNGGDHLTDMPATAARPANTGRSAVILLAALAVHSILEMTALGLASTFGDSALLSLSIALHQVTILQIPILSS
jgi:hypothetical protein